MNSEDATSSCIYFLPFLKYIVYVVLKIAIINISSFACETKMLRDELHFFKSFAKDLKISSRYQILCF